jgi:hypothetical protein
MNSIAGILCSGSAPDSWSVWFARDARQKLGKILLNDVAAGNGWSFVRKHAS